MSIPIPELKDAIQAVQAQTKAAKEKARVTKATQDFEAVFIGMMLKQMRKSMTGQNALFGNSSEAKSLPGHDGRQPGAADEPHRHVRACEGDGEEHRARPSHRSGRFAHCEEAMKGSGRA